MSAKRQLFNLFAAPYAAIVSRANRFSVLVSERTRPIYGTKANGVEVRFHCPNEITLWRAKTLLTKESDTIAWIDSMAADELLFDVGANVGMYSIYAGARGLAVRAFEPEAQNYALLNRNIHLNSLTKVIAYNIALGRDSRFDLLHIRTSEVGNALNNLGAPAIGHEFQPAFKQGVSAFSLDDLVYTQGFPVPEHVKIDVDGLEPQIIDGSARLLADTRLQSILIELDARDESHLDAVGKIQHAGFRLVSRFHAPLFDESEFKSIFNFIFRRV